MIYLAAYNPEWKHLFTVEKEQLSARLLPHTIAIEHIGSTAIGGIYAKPVIDIVLGVTSLAIADEYLVAIIQQLGYDYISQYEIAMPYRRFFQKDDVSGVRTHQIHLVEKDSEFWVRHILFRDYLQAHPAIAKQYEQLKLQLAKIHTDSNQYATAKTEFIRRIECEAASNNGRIN